MRRSIGKHVACIMTSSVLDCSHGAGRTPRSVSGAGQRLRGSAVPVAVPVPTRAWELPRSSAHPGAAPPGNPHGPSGRCLSEQPPTGSNAFHPRKGSLAPHSPHPRPRILLLLEPGPFPARLPARSPAWACSGSPLPRRARRASRSSCRSSAAPRRPRPEPRVRPWLRGTAPAPKRAEPNRAERSRPHRPHGPPAPAPPGAAPLLPRPRTRTARPSHRAWARLRPARAAGNGGAPHRTPLAAPTAGKGAAPLRPGFIARCAGRSPGERVLPAPATGGVTFRCPRRLQSPPHLPLDTPSHSYSGQPVLRPHPHREGFLPSI